MCGTESEDMVFEAGFERKRFRYENLKRYSEGNAFQSSSSTFSFPERYDACYYVIKAPKATIKNGFVRVRLVNVVNLGVYVSGGRDKDRVETLFNDGSAIDGNSANYLNTWYRLDKD